FILSRCIYLSIVLECLAPRGSPPTGGREKKRARKAALTLAAGPDRPALPPPHRAFLPVYCEEKEKHGTGTLRAGAAAGRRAAGMLGTKGSLRLQAFARGAGPAPPGRGRRGHA